MVALGASGDGAGEGAASGLACAALTGSFGGMLPLGGSVAGAFASRVACALPDARSGELSRGFSFGTVCAVASRDAALAGGWGRLLVERRSGIAVPDGASASARSRQSSWASRALLKHCSRCVGSSDSLAQSASAPRAVSMHNSNLPPPSAACAPPAPAAANSAITVSLVEIMDVRSA
jgi:hypothetical protein